MTWEATPTGKRGRQPDCRDAAIRTCLTMKVPFGMVDGVAPWVRATMSTRQATGFVESLLRLIGPDRAVPDFSTLSRRQKTLKVNIPYRGSDGPLHLLVDSTGIKAEGAGERNARKHVGPKRRRHCRSDQWRNNGLRRRIRIGLHGKSLQIRAAGFTTSEIGDVEPGSATGSSEPAMHAGRAARPDPGPAGDRHRHRRWRLRHAQVP
jgi:hypothetical protein